MARAMPVLGTLGSAAPPAGDGPCRPLPREPKLLRKLRVAVVGAGVGGSSTAYWLREAYGEDLDLTVFSEGQVGGRCRPVSFEGAEYEAGAAIISELNWHFVTFMNKFGLVQRCIKDCVFSPMGIFDGKRFIVRSPDPARMWFRWLASFFEALCMIWRFGFAGLMRLKKLAKGPKAPNFPRFYELQSRGEAFQNPEQLLEALHAGMPQLASRSAESWLVGEQGIPERLVHELATGGMRCNYGGQGCGQLHALVGYVSIAGGLASRCFGVVGGNDQVPRKALDAAAPKLLGAAACVRKRVTHFEVVPAGAEGGPAEEFDLVVVAHPLERTSLRFEGFATDVAPQRCGSYRRCVAHFVRGTLRREAFGVDKGALPIEILTIEDTAAPFYSIGLQFPITTATREQVRAIVDSSYLGEPQSYKVFAPRPLSEEELLPYFAPPRVGEGLPFAVVDWYAYPEYKVPQPFRSFVIDEDGVFYLNAIEQAASAMEMCMISARNAVNLVRNWVNHRRAVSGDI